MASTFRFLLHLEILLILISYCATSEATYRDNEITLSSDEEAEQFDEVDDSERWDDSEEQKWDQLGNMLEKLINQLKAFRGGERGVQAACGVYMDDMNWFLLAMKSVKCITRTITPTAGGPDRDACSSITKDEMRSCLKDLFEVAGCFSLWSTYKDYLYNPVEIFENGWKAFCSEERSPRIIDAINYVDYGGETLTKCVDQKFKELIEEGEMFLINRGAKLDFEDVCGDLDLIGEGIASSMRICSDSYTATKTTLHLSDFIMGLAFKCPQHLMF